MQKVIGRIGTTQDWVISKLRGLFLAEQNLFLLLSVIIGLYAGLAVVCFRMAIEWSRLWLLGSALTPSGLRVILVPTVAGLAVALLVIYFFPRVRGSGVNQTKAAVYIYDGYIPFSTVTGKFVTCSLAIGSGQSLGPEDPSLQMGAGLASALGRRLHLSRDKVRLISPVGAAAGLAAAFNAPIASVIFVIEEVIGKWSAGVLGAIVLGAVSSVTVVRWFLGAEPLFRVPVYRLVHPVELAAYAALGVIGGFASLGFVKLVFWLRALVRSLPPWTKYALPAAAGLVIGIIGVWVPQVMGAGYEFMDQAMHNQFTWQMLAVLATLKILATSVSFVGGAPGGLFAPVMFIGAMIGGAVGGVQQGFFPQFTGPVGAYALVGIGTLFAGILRVPMTSVFMVLEVSGHYSIILPVMISNTIAYLISRRFQPTPIFDRLAREEGIGLPSMEELREELPLLVEDAMRPRPRSSLDWEDGIGAALGKIEDSPEDYFLVRQQRGAWRGVGKEFLRRQASEGNGHVPLREVVSGPDLPSLHPDQPLDAALRVIGGWPLLPVVHRANQNLVGIISLSDILNAYRKSGGRSPEVEHPREITESAPSEGNPGNKA